MKRTTTILMLAAMAVFLAAGTAFAASVSCPGGGVCEGTSNNDTIRGGTGNDSMLGGAGDDKMYGGSGQDMVKGNRDNDTIQGGVDADKVKGGEGRDDVKGGPGDDIVRAGSHGRTNDQVPDVLDCGDGTDTAYFVAGQDTVTNCEVLNPPE